MSNNALFLLLFIVQSLSIQCDNFNEDNNWDTLVFSQHWPLTFCSQWLKENIKNSCMLPHQKDLWTVHGLWPTKTGTRGPWGCNNTWHFNENTIKPIESQLDEYWTNIKNNSGHTSFWSHEWNKHGTCAASLPQLNNELKYFKKGIELIQKFNMNRILQINNINPGLDGYTVEEIFNTIKNVLNRVPVIQCLVDKDSKESLLSEIQICFDKSFNLIDCAGKPTISQYSDILTDCNLKKMVYYPNKVLASNRISVVNTQAKSIENLIETKNYWVGVYKTVKFLIWATI